MTSMDDMSSVISRLPTCLSLLDVANTTETDVGQPFGAGSAFCDILRRARRGMAVAGT